MKKFTNYIVVLLLVAGVCACDNKEKAEAEEPAVSIVEKASVKTTTVTTHDFSPVVETSGTLNPAQHTKLTALAGGRIDDIFVDIGIRVNKGDALFQTRTVDYELALSQAEASLSKADAVFRQSERERKRIDNLFSAGSATEQMKDQAHSTFEQAAAALKLAAASRDKARQALSDCTIEAPYDGVITDKFIQEGEFVAPGTPVLEIMDLSVLNAELELPEKYAGKIVKGLDVELKTSSVEGAITGKIIAVNPKVETSNRSFLVKVAIDNTDGNLQAGLFATAIFNLPVKTTQTAVDSRAISRDRGRTTVWVVEDNKVFNREIKDNGVIDNLVWVTRGIEPGEVVVTDGKGSLIQGAEVIIEK